MLTHLGGGEQQGTSWFQRKQSINIVISLAHPQFFILLSMFLVLQPSLAVDSKSVCVLGISSNRAWLSNCEFLSSVTALLVAMRLLLTAKVLTFGHSENGNLGLCF